MSVIYNMSAGFLVTYIASKGDKGEGISMEDIFKRLSVEMGGDGKSITKKQLDDYIKNAESGTIEVDESKLKALKNIQANWDNISHGKDQITFDDMKGFYILLAATMTGNFQRTEIEDKDKNEDEDKTSSQEKDVSDYLQKKYGLHSKDEIKKSHLDELLNDLLTQKNKNVDANSDLESTLIDTVTHMIASYNKTSTVETEA